MLFVLYWLCVQSELGFMLNMVFMFVFVSLFSLLFCCFSEFAVIFSLLFFFHVLFSYFGCCCCYCFFTFLVFFVVASFFCRQVVVVVELLFLNLFFIAFNNQYSIHVRSDNLTKLKVN